MPDVAPRAIVNEIREKARTLGYQIYYDGKHGRTYMKVKSDHKPAWTERLILGEKWVGPIGSILQKLHERGFDAFEVYDTWGGVRSPCGPYGIRIRTR